jgi:hypothetical protein
MNDQKTELITAGSEGIPQRRSDGVAGTSREVSQCDHRPSGAECAGRENEELEWARKNIREIDQPTGPVPENTGEPGGTGQPGKATGKKPGPADSVRKKTTRLVERATGLKNEQIGRPPESKSVKRRRTLLSIWKKDSEIPYIRFETAIRDLICSLMERQDRMNEAIFERILDIEYRLENLVERIRAKDTSEESG